MKLIFMGTPDFAVPSLERLLADGHTVSLVVTQPDKPVGRKQIMTPPAVKVCAESHGLAVYQPTSMRTQEAYDRLAEEQADAIIVVAYGKILPKAILDLTPNGCINVHGSLLPRYRGAAPVQWAVLNGDTEAGVTTMLLDEGVDTGDMLLTFSRPLDDTITGGELFDLLAADGADLLSRTLDALQKGTLVPTPQPEEGACYASMLNKSMCPLDWTKPARALHNQVRGMNPWPVATCCMDGKTTKVFVTRVGENTDAVPGTVVAVQPLTVACGDGTTLIIDELQAEGSRRMAAADYLRGHPVAVNTILT
jgi:methionyl-tRNA formyltransferase